MKSKLLLFILVLTSTLAFGQYRQKTNKGQKIYVKFVTAPGLDVNPIAKQIAINAFFSETMLVNGKFFMGLAGSLTVSGLTYVDKMNYTAPIDIYQAGVHFGSYFLPSRRNTEPSFSIFTGVGRVSVKSTVSPLIDTFAFFMPELTLEQSISDQTRICLGVYYRLAFKSTQLFTNQELSNVGVRLTFKFDYY